MEKLTKNNKKTVIFDQNMTNPEAFAYKDINFSHVVSIRSDNVNFSNPSNQKLRELVASQFIRFLSVQLKIRDRNLKFLGVHEAGAVNLYHLHLMLVSPSPSTLTDSKKRYIEESFRWKEGTRKHKFKILIQDIKDEFGGIAGSLGYINKRELGRSDHFPFGSLFKPQNFTNNPRSPHTID
jgi:hypothetical protein